MFFEQDLPNARTRRSTPGSVLRRMIDDRCGHGAGDAVLQSIATRLRATPTADIVAARYGGAEFALFIPGSADRARPLLDRLLTVIRQPVESEAAVIEFSEEMAGVVTARRELAKTVVGLRERNRELEQQVQLDALTGLRSRRALDEVLGTICGGNDGSANQHAVAFLDTDHFGHYNKHHGDDRGDEALRQVAQLVQSVARRGDLVFRKGGEEIVVVLPDATDKKAQQAAERKRAAVEQAGIQHSASPQAAVITIAVGVASSHGSEPVTIQQLMDRAAWAAMHAKVQARRNQVHVA